MEGVWMQISFNLDAERFKLFRVLAKQQSLGAGELATQIIEEFLDKKGFQNPEKIVNLG